MVIPLQIEIKNKKNYYEYLKENSFWYKNLNRSVNSYNNFNTYIKDKYRLKITDKLGNAMDNIDMISKILDIIK